MNTTPNDRPDASRAETTNSNILPIAPAKEQKQCAPEIEARIRQAIAFVLGELFDAKEELRATFEPRVEALEILSDRAASSPEEALELLKERVATLEQHVNKRLEMEQEYRAVLWADYDERKQLKQRQNAPA